MMTIIIHDDIKRIARLAKDRAKKRGHHAEI